jgi:peroxiredoxin
MKSLQRLGVIVALGFLSAGLAAAGPLGLAGDGKKPEHKTGQTPPQKPPAKPPEKKPEPKPEPKPAPKPEAPKRVAIGDEVDGALAFEDTDGKAHALKEYRGKIVAIALWSVDCPTCKLYEARVKKLNDDYSAKGVVVLAVDPNAAEAEHLKEFSSKNPLGASVMSDPGQKFVQKVGALSTPEIYILDAKGMLRYKGAIDDDAKGEKADKAKTFARTALDEMVGGKPVTTATTTATGTLIKVAPAKKPEEKKPEEKPAPPKKN